MIVYDLLSVVKGEHAKVLQSRDLKNKTGQCLTCVKVRHNLLTAGCLPHSAEGDTCGVLCV